MPIKLKPLTSLYITQFLSAFADNMILFITLAIINRDHYPLYYLGIVQASFLVAYILMAPFVGAFADKNPKSKVLLIGNIIKGLGMLGLICGMDPALSYAIVGVGAAIYSPAKYGILPDLTSTVNELHHANGRMEGFTIFAILSGTVVGGIIAQKSIILAMIVCLLLYIISIFIGLLIPSFKGNKNISYLNSMQDFFKSLKTLFNNKTTNFSLIGTGAFWMASSVLRIAILAWIPIHLAITDVDKASMIVGSTAIGILLGSLISPLIIPVHKYFKSYIFGFIMTGLILLFPFIHSVSLTVILLILIGFMGGIFIIPMNTVLQEESKKTVGTGKTIAIQNFVENVLMVSAVGLYSLLTKLGVPIDVSIVIFALILGLLVYSLKRKIPFLKR